jgi:MbtH protein
MSEDVERSYKVLINDEEQYAIFPAVLETPGGWREDGFTGSEDECVSYVDATWTDMRPRSLREAMRA